MSVRKRFDEEMKDMKDELVKMCRIAEYMIAGAVEALKTADTETAKIIAGTDKQVNDLELDIETKCFRILLRRQPVSKDFREVSTALKMITDIERIGDQARDIAYLVADGLDVSGASHTAFKKMGDVAVKMVHDSVGSFIKNDEPLADATIQLDDKLDDYFAIIKKELTELIKIKPDCTDKAVMLLMAAKYLERIGDHSVNICEWTKFNETGVHTKY